jgi:hypothetical protein
MTRGMIEQQFTHVRHQITRSESLVSEQRERLAKLGDDAPDEDSVKTSFLQAIEALAMYRELRNKLADQLGIPAV